MTGPIPNRHEDAACPACSTGLRCRVATRGHARYWDLYRSDPDKWAAVIVRDALADRAGVQPIIPKRPRASGEAIAGYPDCALRSCRWSCNNETIATCPLDHGAGGIVEADDCSNCRDRQTPGVGPGVGDGVASATADGVP